MTTWTRSSRCGGGSCVEVAYTAACTSGNCVQVGACCGDILVRDSKNPDQQPLRFTTDEWQAFLAGVQAGEFPAPGGAA